MFKKFVLVLAVIMLVILSGCNNGEGTEPSITGEVINEEKVIVEVNLPEEKTMGEVIEIEALEPVDELEVVPAEPVEAPKYLTMEGIEGDLMSLQPEAFDPDGDFIEYTFTKPFNEEVLWQTKEGDEGTYLVTVTASDGALSTSETIRVLINPTNKAPIIECADELMLKEGDLLEVTCNIYDLEGDDFEVKYNGWLNSPSYQTTFSDAGIYMVNVYATDAENTREKSIKVTVEDVNRAPVFTNLPEEIKVMETETLKLNLTVEDLDGDTIVLTFAEPLDEKGVWATKLDNAGTYLTSVVASDGTDEVEAELKIIVTQMNTAPTLENMMPITVNEGETVELPINAMDREGDAIELTISGWMNTATYETSFEDAGVHSVTVTASDGELESSQDVLITVNDVNRAPIFRIVV